MWGYLWYRGGVQYCGGIQYCGGYHEYHRVLSTVGDIMINVGISLVPWGCSVL